MLDFVTREVQVECLPAEIPDKLTLDVSALHVGQHVEAKDLVLPEGVDADRRAEPGHRLGRGRQGRGRGGRRPRARWPRARRPSPRSSVAARPTRKRKRPRTSRRPRWARRRGRSRRRLQSWSRSRVDRHLGEQEPGARSRQPRDRVRGHPPQPRPRGGGGAGAPARRDAAPRHCQTRFAVDGELVLATPETFMNRSGYAARCLVERYGLDPARMLVVFDDIYLPLGHAAAAHRRRSPAVRRAWPRSSRACAPRRSRGCGSASRRSSLRRPLSSTASSSCSRASRPSEQAAADELILRAAERVRGLARAGAAEAMNRFNRDRDAIA